MLKKPHLRQFWYEYRWLLLGFAWLGGLVLGYFGFYIFAIENGEVWTAGDIIYRTLQLVTMNSGAVDGEISWMLETSRFLLPMLTAYTVLQALMHLFLEQTQKLRLRRLQDHVVICGLGKKGMRLTHHFLELGYEVIVIEADESNDWIEAARSSGAIVITGDASDTEILGKARLNRAKYLISVVGDDGKNAEVAVQAEKLSAARTDGILTCSIHIVDPQLWYLLHEKELYMAADSHIRLELFNIFDRGASMLLKAHPPWASKQVDPTCDKQLVLVGLGKLGQSLIIQAASQWQENRMSSDQHLKFTIIDLDAERKVQELCVMYPHLEEVVQLKALPMNVHSADFRAAEFLVNPDKHCTVDSIYICIDNDALGLHSGLTLNQKIRNHQIPIIVRMAEDAGLAVLLKGKDNTAYKNLHAFPLLDQTCTPDIILHGTHELLARALHEAYLKGLREEHMGEEGDLVLDAWEDLTEEIKERNRKQADRIVLILEKHRFRIAPLSDWRASNLKFGEDEVESMARMEHGLWVQVMVADGWRYGKVRSKKDKTNPDITPWEGLPEDETKKNKEFIQTLPKALAGAGFQIEYDDSNQ